jgi:transglutaminase-like putative cysteine protease
MLTRCHYVAIACLTLATACRTTRPDAFAAPAERDTWYSIGDGDQAYGHMHVRVRRLEDGAAEFTVRSLMQIEVFDTRQELRTTSTAVVGPDLSLRHLDAQSEQMSGRAHVRLRATPDGFELERERDGTVHTSTILHAEGPPIVSSLVLDDWLHRLTATAGPGLGELTRRVRLLTEEVGEPVETTLRLLSRDGGGTIWALEVGEEWSETTLRLDADGRLVEQNVTIPPLHIKRATREQALAIDYRVMPDRELLVFPVDRELPPTRRIQRIDVELTWQDIPPAEFELEDARQRLVSLQDAAGGRSAIVRLENAAGSSVDATRPLPPEGFEATLASDDLVVPDNDGIARTAAEIVGAQTSARGAATAICRWVHDAIQPKMIAETLSGPQVLERRVGKCTEYTTLFASLARAAGIPTRIVLGQRRFAGESGDTWGGHMWNEVFVGEWIPVDASADEFGGSLDLLKFVHSNTVAGTQPLRWKLTRSLGVRIADVELRPTAADAVATGLRGTTYTSAEHGFRVDLPDESWTLEDKQTSGALVLRLRPADPELGDAAMLHVTAFDRPGSVTPKLILDARLEHQRKALENVEVLRDEEAGFEGVDSHRQTFGGVPRDGQPLRISEILLLRGDTGVLINLIATPERHEEYAQALERIARSVVFH